LILSRVIDSGVPYSTVDRLAALPLLTSLSAGELAQLIELEQPCVAASMFGTTFRVPELNHPEIAQPLREAAAARHS
jgi:hypothetical protein